MSLVPLGEESATGVESEFASGGGGDAGEGMAGDVMLSRASGNCAASGVGVEGSIGSRYGSTSL